MFNFLSSANFSLPISLSIVMVYISIILILAEAINRFLEGNEELTRKIVHIGTGNVVLIAWWLKIPASVVIVAAVIASIIALISNRVSILPSINSVGRKSLGTFFYAVSIGVLIGSFWAINQPEYAAIGILIMTWGDGLAALIGKNWGRHLYSIWGINKSWEGSATMLIISFLVTSLIIIFVRGYSWPIFFVCLAVSLLATFLEAFSQWGIDNLTVPIGSAAFCFLLIKAISLWNGRI